MSIHFGSVRIIMQSKALAPLEVYERQEEAIRHRIRGDWEVLGYDREVHEAVQRELGEEPDGRPLWKKADERFEAYGNQLEQENRANPNYQALLLQLGRRSNPLQPEQKALQKLLIDGEDLPRFQKEVFDTAFFQKATHPNGFLKIVPTSVGGMQEQHYGNSLNSAFDNVLNRYIRDVQTQIKQGHQAAVIDLDA
jgi:hypothetical protein